MAAKVFRTLTAVPADCTLLRRSSGLVSFRFSCFLRIAELYSAIQLRLAQTKTTAARRSLPIKRSVRSGKKRKFA
jgi:hypothetical protein